MKTSPNTKTSNEVHLITEFWTRFLRPTGEATHVRKFSVFFAGKWDKNYVKVRYQAIRTCQMDVFPSEMVQNEGFF